jgi:hypothetical protein
MEHTTTRKSDTSGSKALQVLRNTPDWLIIVLVILLALVILGVSLAL